MYVLTFSKEFPARVAYRTDGTAFVIDGSGLLYPRYGVRRVGYLRHLFEGDRHTHEFVEPDCFIGIDLGNWMRAPAGFHARYAEEPLRGLVLGSTSA